MYMGPRRISGRIHKGRTDPLNSANMGLYTGGECLKHPNEWHSVMF